MKKLQLMFLLLFFINSRLFAQLTKTSVVKAPKEFYTLKSAIDSTYGYIINNPIKVKRKDSLSTQQMIYDLCFWFITLDGEHLLLIQSDTKYIQKSKNKKRNRRAETIPIEEFMLETEQSSKPITLYFDTNTEYEIKIPIGLKIDTTTYTIPTYRNIKRIR